MVYLKWIDSAVENAVWIDKDELENKQLLECETVGFLIRETKKKIVICTSHNEGQYQGVFVIPKVAIKQKIFLNKKEKQK